jgi:hypothetical protein
LRGELLFQLLPSLCRRCHRSDPSQDLLGHRGKYEAEYLLVACQLVFILEVGHHDLLVALLLFQLGRSLLLTGDISIQTRTMEGGKDLDMPCGVVVLA